MDLFNQDERNVIDLDPDPSDFNKQEQGYDEVVKEFIIAEKRYLRDLHMITKVFRDLLATHQLATTNELEDIFSNINDVTELTLTLIGSMEDTLEMTEQGNVPAVGTCFEELGMISHKISLIIIFGHKHFGKNFIKNLTFFTKKFQQPLILVHIFYQILKQNCFKNEG